ncbi:type 4a pilus biogenesis protein PilO [Marinospirillum minutulum]|uniref:type 4a pilus biogenesis protein PilO n=1 Tax=Marinospirillum minutulum TaxID=64974 RepID=UPI00041363FE|nr:type 4a pilus biogenesis protein PilO [Marinospirillum minutulum]
MKKWLANSVESIAWFNQAKINLKHWLKGQLRAIKKLERDDLDLANAGQWPDSVKIFSLICIVAGVVFASHWLLLSNYKEELNLARQEQTQLLEDYRLRSFQAANLPAYQQQMRIMEETFSGLLAFLPTGNEIPRLLDDIQQLAGTQRLEILELNLKDAEDNNFYSQLPFELVVRGDFHRLANFMAGMSNLDRIITLHNFTLKPVKPGSSSLNLVVDAQTYRYDQQGKKANEGRRD